MPDDALDPWIRESRLAQLARVPRSTLTSWQRSGVLDRPGDGVFRERDLFLAVMVRAVAAVVPRPDLRHVRRQLETEAAPATAARELRRTPNPRVDLVLDRYTGDLSICHDDESLAQAVRPAHGVGDRSVAVIATGRTLARAAEAFRASAEVGEPPAVPRRGRPPRPSRATAPD